jgi:hypothetical protein
MKLYDIVKTRKPDKIKHNSTSEIMASYQVRHKDIALSLNVIMLRKTKFLQGFYVCMVDTKPEHTFTQEELENLFGFVEKPSHVVIEGKHDPVQTLFNLNYRKGIVFNYLFWHSDSPICQESSIRWEVDGEYQKVKYDWLGEILGIKLDGKKTIRNPLTLSRLNFSALPSAFDWIYRAELCPSIELENDSGMIGVESYLNQYNSDKKVNIIKIGVRVNPHGDSCTLNEKDIESVEEKVRTYRGFSL